MMVVVAKNGGSRKDKWWGLGTVTLPLTAADAKKATDNEILQAFRTPEISFLESTAQ